MKGSLFITLYDKKTLALYLENGIYGFLMKPVFENQPSSRSMHYAALADYACSREGSHVLFFLERKIVYGGTVKGNSNCASFFLNGPTSPLGRAANSEIFWDESNRYESTSDEGVFKVKGIRKSQPFILQFDLNNLSGKEIASDDLYFELGKYPYPLPSNTIQGMSFCTLTPGETEIALSLLKKSNKTFVTTNDDNVEKGENQTIFTSNLVDEGNFINEAHIEFHILANLDKINDFLPNDEYVLCRQIPISPFKPFHMDRADICLYSMTNPIKDGTIPNVIIELKKDRANFNAYNQMHRYLTWLEKITDANEFERIIPILIAPSFKIKRAKIDLKFINKIIMLSLDENNFYSIP